ncbi:hypothetical protein [Macromonas nakdongensis]|uniref:hypothetical protein n=1 Tax=Macromonas nakdongensis TaxID=1843082 RepID=UPI0018E38077|nr:hypothetical protein [Macromonas nakdongensis]
MHSLHWNNIPAAILNGQKAVFGALGIPLCQDNQHGTKHGAWMNDIIARSAENDIVVFCDIDAFPLNRASYEQAVEVAQAGGLFGLAQFSNHKQSQAIYAGPMFMAFRKSLWLAAGCPDFKSSKTHDAGEAMSIACDRMGALITLIKPTACVIPKWGLKDQGLFGIGTFYGDNRFFHLFESRHPAHERLFDAVVADVAAGSPLDFSRYLAIVHGNPSEDPALRKPSAWKRWWTRRFGKAAP